MEFNYIFFDLDGTLTDSGIGIISSVKYALKKYGIEEENSDKLKRFIGPPLTDSFMEYYGFDLCRAKEAVEYYREYYSEKGMYENELYSGIKELLAGLKEKSKIVLLTTSKPKFYAEKILKYFGIEGYFDFVIGSNLDGTLSDKKEIIDEALKISGTELKKESVVMVGDRKFDIEGANYNGIKSIAVLYGYGSYEELEKAGADYKAASVEEINKIIFNKVEG